MLMKQSPSRRPSTDDVKHTLLWWECVCVRDVREEGVEGEGERIGMNEKVSVVESF